MKGDWDGEQVKALVSEGRRKEKKEDTNANQLWGCSLRPRLPHREIFLFQGCEDQGGVSVSCSEWKNLTDVATDSQLQEG